MGGENLHISKTIIIGHLPALPGGILGDSWKLNSAGPEGGISELDSRVLGQLWQGFPHPPSPVKGTCHQCRPRAGPGTHTLALIKAISVSPVLIWDLLLARAAVRPSGETSQTQARPSVGPGSSAARRRVGQQQACVTGKWMGRGEGTSKHSGSLAHVDWWRLPPNSWLEGTQRIQGKEGSVRHIQLCPDTDGKAGPGKEPAPPAVQQADGENLP